MGETVARYKVHLLDQDQVEYYWETISGLLDENTDLWRFVYTKEVIAQEIAENKIQVWTVEDPELIRIFFLTKVTDGPSGRILQVFWMYGTEGIPSMKEIVSAMNFAAFKWGCQFLEATGRDGFRKILKPFGARPVTVSYMREVEPVESRSVN